MKYPSPSASTQSSKYDIHLNCNTSRCNRAQSPQASTPTEVSTSSNPIHDLPISCLLLRIHHHSLIHLQGVHTKIPTTQAFYSCRTRLWALNDTYTSDGCYLYGYWTHRRQSVCLVDTMPILPIRARIGSTLYLWSCWSPRTLSLCCPRENLGRTDIGLRKLKKDSSSTRGDWQQQQFWRADSLRGHSCSNLWYS